jgi:hypothetical protein
VDSCGVAKNISQWAEALANASHGAPWILEQCFDPEPFPWPTLEWCPFHTYRTCQDIAPTFSSVAWNAQTMIPFTRVNAVGTALSRPNCWANPDMLEVGNANGPTSGGVNPEAPPLTVIESRTHFGLWAICSAPLVLGFDVTNASLFDAVWNVVSNTEVIEVNQAWAGSPGSVVADSGTLHFERLFHGASAGTTVPVPMPLPDWQVWAKQLPPLAGASSTRVAVLLANLHPTLSFPTVNVSFESLGLSCDGGAKVRDLWLHADSPTPTQGPHLVVALDPRDSAFFVLEC